MNLTDEESTDSLVVGNSSNFWLYNPELGYDMTHSSSSSVPVRRLKINTTTAQVTIDPKKTVLIIIDMQNYFLSPALGRVEGQGHKAERTLLEKAIPAARKAGIQVVYVNWGIDEDQLKLLPPVIFRIFGFHIDPIAEDVVVGTEKESKRNRGIGEPMGDVKLSDGSIIDAGRLLMRKQWNSDLHDPMKKSFDESQATSLPDLNFPKVRLSGFWRGFSPASDFLRANGFKTLLFAGENTDQCVLSSVKDATDEGFNTILLKDGCGTTSPEFATKMVLFNCHRAWGFVSSCEALSEGVDEMPQ